MRRFGLVIFIILMVLAVTGCGKKSGLEGKVVDGKGKPMANVKIIAKQVQPIKGYEQFEATTGSDGTFSFEKLFPTSEYVLFPWFDDWSSAPQRTLKYEANKLTARFNKEGWTTEDKMKVQSGPEGQTTMLASPMIIQPCISTITAKLVDGRKRPLKGIKIVAKQVISRCPDMNSLRLRPALTDRLVLQSFIRIQNTCLFRDGTLKQM